MANAPEPTDDDEERDSEPDGSATGRDRASGLSDDAADEEAADGSRALSQTAVD